MGDVTPRWIRSSDVDAAIARSRIPHVLHHATKDAEAWEDIVHRGIDMSRSRTRGHRDGGELIGFYTAPEHLPRYGDYDVQVVMDARQPLEHSVYERAKVVDAIVDDLHGAGTAASLPDEQLFRVRREALLARGHDSLVARLGTGQIAYAIAVDPSIVRVVVPDDGPGAAVRAVRELQPPRPARGAYVAAAAGAVTVAAAASAAALQR